MSELDRENSGIGKVILNYSGSYAQKIDMAQKEIGRLSQKLAKKDARIEELEEEYRLKCHNCQELLKVCEELAVRKQENARLKEKHLVELDRQWIIDVMFEYLEVDSDGIILWVDLVADKICAKFGRKKVG
jgi:DNA repair exonuclease SbcCD ATPase subunit